MTLQTCKSKTETAIIRYRGYYIKHSRRTDKWLAKRTDDIFWTDGIQSSSLKALKQDIDTVMTKVTHLFLDYSHANNHSDHSNQHQRQNSAHAG